MAEETESIIISHKYSIANWHCSMGAFLIADREKQRTDMTLHPWNKKAPTQDTKTCEKDKKKEIEFHFPYFLINQTEDRLYKQPGHKNNCNLCHMCANLYSDDKTKRKWSLTIHDSQQTHEENPVVEFDKPSNFTID